MSAKRWLAAVAVLLPLACEGHTTVYQTIISGGAPSSGGNAGQPSPAGGGSESTAGAAAPGGAPSAAGGAPSAAGGAPDAAGGASEAGAGGVPCGSSVADVPGDCHATIACSDARVIDQNDVPKPTNACVLGTCNRAGVPGTAPAPADTPCSAAGGGIVCNGAGKCVSCVHTSDCGDGLVCSAGNECVAAACTDVDCGGACPPCKTGKKCLVDADCESFACDAAALTCITPQCQDHRQDGVETDADCGGGFCSPCVLGKGCAIDDDCNSHACDALSLTCVSNACNDHRVDGDETDVDCGGAACNLCLVGMKCKSNFDCQSGHFCNVSKVCM